MKICDKTIHGKKCKRSFFKDQCICAVVLIWICCCYQGDEARPSTFSYKHLVTLECHVILKGTVQTHVTPTCSCNCSIWCKELLKCVEWYQNFSGPIFVQYPIATYSKCCEPLLFSALLDEVETAEFSLRCKENQIISNATRDIDQVGETSYLIFCTDHRQENACFNVHSNPWKSDSLVLKKRHKGMKNVFVKFQTRKRNLFRTRLKRSQSYSPPYQIQVQNKLFTKIAVLQYFDINLSVQDTKNNIVENLNGKFSISIDGSVIEPNEILNGPLEADIKSGRALFSQLQFKKNGENYRLKISYSGLSSDVLPWVSEPITVTERELVLKPSGRVPPLSSRENYTLSPSAGVIIFDVMNNAPAKKGYLSKYTWEGSIGLLYDDVYSGQIIGSTYQLIEDGSHEILFNDIIISSWGYSYILRIKVRARETAFWDLSCLIGPFDVDMLDTFDFPLIESSEFRRVQIIYDGSFQKVQEDATKFKIFILNYFGRRYPRVRWQNVTVTEGSVVVDAVITGLTEDLEKTTEALSNDITSGKADIEYENSKTWKANRVFVPSRKLLEETETTESQSSDDGGGLSVAWIVAIVINVILIAIFIIAIIYCWHRRKKQNNAPRSESHLKHFDKHPAHHALFVNKAENHKMLQDKTALMDATRKAAVFSVEDEHQRLHNQDHDDERLKDENEDDPPGYPTPSPEPVFPTPIPTPEPEEDFWRPEPTPEPEEMSLPGAISEPEPPREDLYYVYLITDMDGSRELIGQLYLQTDFYLSDVRRVIEKDRNLAEYIRKKEYKFLDDNLEIVHPYQESSMNIERVYPSQEIYLQPKLPDPPDPPRRLPKVPAYVGPLGICSASDCTRAAKIKCLDCRNVAYCSKRCMQNDVKEHRRACYKPAWRL